MPWRKKTKTATDWKPIRCRKAWIDMLREAHKKNPDFSPTFDLGGASEPHLIHVACQVASLYISGWFWERLTPEIDRIVELARVETAVNVATHLGAAVRKNQDGTLTISKTGLADGIVPETIPMQRPTMLH